LEEQTLFVGFSLLRVLVLVEVVLHAFRVLPCPSSLVQGKIVFVYFPNDGHDRGRSVVVAAEKTVLRVWAMVRGLIFALLPVLVREMRVVCMFLLSVLRP